MAVVGGPVGFLLVVLWPGMGWYLRRLGRMLRWSMPHAISSFCFAVKYLLLVTRLVMVWLLWAARLAFRLFWGADYAGTSS